MPQHPGSVHNPNGGGQGFIGSPAPPTAGPLSVPEQVLPDATPGPEAMSEIIQMLRGGQVGAERFMMVLNLLAGSTLPEMGAGAAGQQQPSQDPSSIQGLLG